MTGIDLKNKKKIHFIGIGGIGMSAVAYILLEQGYTVSGSDLKDSNLLKKLRDKGANIFIGHSDSNLGEDVDMVVYTPCIKKDNPEMAKAESLKIPLVHRQMILASLMRERKGIAVTGAHGKGTTTAILGTILIRAGLDPTVIVGAEVVNLNGNARLGRGDFLVMEADESDGSFVELEPYYAIITNIDREHLEYYKDVENIISTNRAFINKIKQQGCLFCLQDDKYIAGLLKNYKKRYKTFSLSKNTNIYAKDIITKDFMTTFKCIYNNKNVGTFNVMLPGEHNVLNALAAISVALEMGIEAATIKTGLLDYKGALRRFELKAGCGDILVIEDYAHHPKEIEVTLRVCKNWNKGRVISIFQPHRFTRTQLLADDFAKAFDLADELILTDIYSAFEQPLENVSSKLIFDEVKRNGRIQVFLLPKEEIIEHLSSRVNKGDVVLVLGAGDIGEISGAIVQRIRSSIGK